MSESDGPKWLGLNSGNSPQGEPTPPAPPFPKRRAAADGASKTPEAPPESAPPANGTALPRRASIHQTLNGVEPVSKPSPTGTPVGQGTTNSIGQVPENLTNLPKPPETTSSPGLSDTASHLPGSIDLTRVAQANEPTDAPARSEVEIPGSNGTNVEEEDSETTVSAKKKPSWLKRIFFTLLLLFFLMIIAGSAAFFYLYARTQIPEPDAFAQVQTTTVLYEDGETEVGTFSEVNRTIIDISTLPDYVGNAIVASEDRTFYTNSGVDVKGIFRALITNLRTGSRQGGSTLSQQYVENYYTGEATKGYRDKLDEAILALKINREQPKKEILANYMNTIYFGRGAYGIEAAAQAYFGIPASQLDLSQAALLSGIIPAPSVWDPAVDPQQAESRWARVLELMEEDGWASPQDVAAATFPETIDPNANISSMTGTTGYLMQQVRAELLASEEFTVEELEAGGLVIVTTLNEDMQRAAEESMRVMPQDTPDEVRVALSAVDNETGAILAEYPGSDYEKIQTNAVTQDISQAGSTFKPFALLNSIEQGGSIYDSYNGNSPLEIQGVTVNNNDGYSFGYVDMVTATMYSINTAYVELNDKYGPASTMETLVEAGIPEDTPGLEPTLLNVLGSASPTNIDLNTAYATLANGGERVDPHMVAEVKDTRGVTLYKADTDGERVFEAAAVTRIMPALESVVDEGGTGSKVAILDRTMGGKTGTSDEQRSAHFIGFIPQITTAVSMYGTDQDGNSIPLPNIGGMDQFHGSDWPVDVWLAFMDAVTYDMPKAEFNWLDSSDLKGSNRSTQQQAPKRVTQPDPKPEKTEQTPQPQPTPEPAPAPTPTPEPEKPVQPEQPEPEEPDESQSG